MANEQAGAAPAPKQKKAPRAKGDGGSKKKAAPTGPAPKYKRETTPRMSKLYNDRSEERRGRKECR